MYSIKTDLGVSGNATINKDLLVNGNAVLKGNLNVDGLVTFANATFTQITVTGAANLADINSTGAANLANVNVSGNTVLGDASTDSLTVNSTSTFVAPVNLQNNITQSAGTASFKDTSVDALTVAGVTTLNGNLDMGVGTVATIKSTVTDSLTVNDNATIGGTLGVTGKSTFGDVEINGTLSGTYTMNTGNFNNIVVSQLSDLNNVSIKGATTLTGNVTGATSTVSVNRLNMQGADSIVEFAYNDPSRPTDIKSSIQPYQVSSQKLVSKEIESDAAKIGVVGGTTGLHAIGRATIDYLNITGNSTIGSQNQLTVAGTSVFTGKTTVGDLEITGSVSGLSFTDLNVNTLTVSGISSLAAVTLSGNITGSNSSIAKFSTFTVGDGTAGNHGIIQFEYNDSARPTDIKSSIEPYQISSNNFVSKDVKSDSATIGVIGGTAGLTALGVSNMDYVHIKGNSTIGTAQPQLKVDGKSILGDVDFTGVVTGLTVDVSGQDLTPNSVVAAAAIKGQTLESTTTTKVGTDLTVGGTAGITGNTTVGGTLGVTGITTLGGDVTVNGQTVTVKDLVVTGTTTGVTVTANVDGLDIAPNSVAAVAGVSSATLEVTGASTLTGNITAGADITVTGTVQGAASGPLKTGALSSGAITSTGSVSALSGAFTQAGTGLTVTNDASIGGKLTVKDVDVTGVLTPASIDLSTTAVSAASVTTTGNVNVGGDLVVTGTVDLSGADVTAKTFTASELTQPSTLPVLNSTTATIANLNATDIDATGDISAASVAATGSVSAASITAPSIQAASAGAGTVNVASDLVAAKNLTVTGTFSPNGGIDTTGNITTTGDVSADNVTATGIAKADSIESATIQAAPLGAGTVTIASNGVAAKDFTVNGVFTPAGGLDLSSADITATSITTTAGATIGGNLSVAGTVDLTGADVTALSFVSSDALKTNTFPKLASTESNIGTLTVTGESTLAAVSASNVTASGTLGVTGATTLAGVTAGAINAASLTTTADITSAGAVTVTGAVSAASFTTAGTTIGLSKNTSVTGDLAVSGTLTAGVIDLSTTDVTVKSLNSLGNAHVVGNLTVDGLFDLSSTNLSALSLASTNDTTVGGALSVTGESTLSTLSTSGLATLNSASVTTTLSVTGASTLAGVSATNVTASGTLGVTGATTLSTLSTSGLATLNSASVTGTLGVTGTTTLAGLTAGATSVGTLASSGKATLASLEITGATVAKGNLTVEGTLLPQGGLDLTGADISANSLALAAGATVGTTLGVTGNTTVGGTLGVTGITTLGVVNAGAITGTGAGKFGSVTSDNGLTVTTGNATVTAGNLSVTAGNITQGGASSTAVLQKTTTSNLHVGSLVWDEVEYIAEIGGNTHISGDLDVDGTINAQINLTGRDIAPRDINASRNVSVGGTLGVTGQATMASAIIGAPDSVNNNLQINGNTVCTGNFTVQGLIIGTLDQTTSDITVKSVTATTFVKGATLESTGGATIGTTLSTGGKVTVAAGGVEVTAGGVKTDTLQTTGAAIIGGTTTAGGKVSISAGGLSVVGGSSSDTLTVTGLSTLAGVNATNVSASGTLAVTGTSTFTGLATVADLTSTGLITANNLTVTGTLNANIADLVTDSVVTKKYAVVAKGTESVAAGTWTPDGTSNVYNITLTGNITMGALPVTLGQAGSWFVYITQDSVGSRTVTWGAPYTVVGAADPSTAVNGTPNSVTICQFVYCGVGSVIDVFVAQRNV